MLGFSNPAKPEATLDTMLAAVLRDFNDLRVEQVPIPRAVDYGDVIVRIKSCGICATDYKAI